MSKWIKVYPHEIITLSFRSIWFYKKVAHTIEAFDYGQCKIRIRKKKLTNKPTIKFYYDEAKHI